MLTTAEKVTFGVSIADGESDILEFKKSTSNLTDIMKTLCGFLNTKGGQVVTGVSDSGKIVGHDVSDATRQEIARELQKFEPSLQIEVNYVDHGSKKLIVFTAKPDASAVPYIYDGRAYERTESSTTVMSQYRYQQLLMSKSHDIMGWEILPAQHMTIDDLDHAEIFKTLSDGVREGRIKESTPITNVTEALMRLKLLTHDKITNAAVALFAKDPMPYYPQCLIKLVLFKGKTKSNLIDSKHVYGNIFTLLDEAESFLLRHMSIASKFHDHQFKREDIPEYPPRAVREALVNAFSHRDYTIVGGSICLFMYDDRLEVISHGQLPRGITVDQLKVPHQSQPRNTRITNVLFRRGIIESVGTGTQEIVKYCHELKLPEPEFAEEGNAFVVRFWRSENANFNGDNRSKSSLQLTDRQSNILKLSEKQPDGITLEEIQNSLSANISSRTIRRDLELLTSLGMLTTIRHNRRLLWIRVKD